MKLLVVLLTYLKYKQKLLQFSKSVQLELQNVKILKSTFKRKLLKKNLQEKWRPSSTGSKRELIFQKKNTCYK